MADEDDIGIGGLMRLEPGAEVIAGDVDGTICLVARVDLGVNDVGVGDEVTKQRVDMSGKRAERLGVSVEAVDVNDEEQPARDAVEHIVGHQGLRRSASRVRPRSREETVGAGRGRGRGRRRRRGVGHDASRSRTGSLW